MKDAFSLVAAAFGFAVFLTTFQSEGYLPAAGWGPSAPAAQHLSDQGNGCHLYGPLLADISSGIDVLSRLRGV